MKIEKRMKCDVLDLLITGIDTSTRNCFYLQRTKEIKFVDGSRDGETCGDQ